MSANITLSHEPKKLQSFETEWATLLESSQAFGAALTWPWINIWIKHFNHLGELWLLEARDENTNELIGIAPLFKTRFKPKYGTRYRQIEFIGASHWHENLDFIIQSGREAEIIPLFLGALYDHKNQWDVLLLSSLDSPNTVEILQKSGLTWQRNEIREILSPYSDLPTEPETWMKSLSKNRRWKLRRYIRDMEEKFGGNWEIHPVTTEENLDSVFDQLVMYHQAHWEELGKPGAFHYGEWTGYLRELMHAFFEKGWLRLNCLCINDHPEVVLFSYHYAKRAYNQISGYNPNATDIPIGHIMTRFSIESAIRDGMEKYFFMWGDEGYKYSFGAEDRTLKAYEHVRNPFIKFQKNTIATLKSLKNKAKNQPLE